MNNIPPCFYRVSIKGLILNEKKEFLLCKENNGNRSLPGGGMDFGETAEATIKREIKEEMGLEVINVSKQPSYFLSAEHKNRTHRVAHIVYEIEVKNLDFTPSKECQEIKFFDIESASKSSIAWGERIFIQQFNPDNH